MIKILAAALVLTIGVQGVDPEQHPDVLAAKAELESATALRQKAFAGWAPTVRFTAEERHGYLRDTIDNIEDPSQYGPQRMGRAELTQPLFRAFTLFDELDLADYEIEAKAAALDAARASVIAEGLAVQVRLWGEAEIVTLRKTAIAQAKAAADGVSELSKAKEQAPGEMPRALDRIARAQVAYADSEAQLEAAKAAHIRLWGVPSSAVTAMPVLTYPCNSPDECIDAAGLAPIVIQSLAQERAAELKVMQIKLSRMPVLDAFAFVQRTDVEYGLPTGRDRSQSTNEAQAGLRLTTQLPWGLEASADLSQANANLKAAARRTDSVKLKTKGRALEFWTRASISRRSAEAAEAQIKSASAALLAIRESYRAGDMSIRDVLDEQDGLTSARVGKVRFIMSEAEALAGLAAIAEKNR